MWKKLAMGAALALSLCFLPNGGEAAYPVGAMVDGSGEVSPEAVAQAQESCAFIEGLVRLEAFPCRVLATTYKEGDLYGAALAEDEDGTRWLIGIDLSAEDKVAAIKSDKDMYSFYMRTQDGRYMDVLVCKMLFFRDEQGADKKLGIWKNKTHILPLYIFYDVKDGDPYQMVSVTDKIWSGEGTLFPSHYHAAVKEENRIRFIREFLRHIPPLHDSVNVLAEAGKISYPY